MALLLFCSLFLVYAPSFTVDYLTNDEVGMIGTDWRDYDFTYHALAHGRLLSNYRPFIYEFVGYSPTRVQLVRFVFFLGLAAIAILLQRFLARESKRPWFSFFTILFLFSQLPFQTFSGFSLDLVSYVLPTVTLSLAAFWLHYYVFPRRGTSRWIALPVVFLLLFAAMQSAQSWAFFAMAPAAFLVLSGRRQRFVQTRSFIALGVAVLVLSVPVYLAGLEVLADQGRQGYAMGEGIFTVAKKTPLQLIGHTLNPRTYWTAFKLWNYPYPFHDTGASEGRRHDLAMTVFAIWLALAIAAFVTEMRGRADPPREIVSRWLAAVVCLGFGAFVLVAASPVWVREFRSHLTLVLSACIIFIGAHSLLVLSKRYDAFDARIARGLAIALALVTAFGAQSGLLRGYVETRADQLDFIRTELMAKRPSEYNRIVVVLGPRRNFCASEPCDAYSSRVTHNWWHARRPERYRYALSTLGFDPAKKAILVVEGEFEPRPRDLVVDWDKYFRARRRLARTTQR